MDQKLKIFEVSLSTEEFEQVRSDARFLLLLRLTRIVNQLNFCFDVYLSASNYNTPAGERQYFNGFLFSCGVLYEGLKLIPILNKEFSSYKYYQDGFAKLWKDKDTHYLKEKVLNKMRNGIVFHIDSKPIEETTQVLKLDSYQFAAGSLNMRGETYFNLADVIALNYIIGNPGNKEEEEKIIRNILTKLSKVITNYSESSDKLVGEFVKEMKWQVREVQK